MRIFVEVKPRSECNISDLIVIALVLGAKVSHRCVAPKFGALFIVGTPRFMF